MAKLIWTPELDAEVRDLWELGWPSVAIAEEIGATKNSIIGRAFRQKWVWASRRVTHAPKLAAPPPSGQPPTLLDLKPHQCKWPVNEPPKGGTYLFCGEGTINGNSYCEAHAAIGFSGKGTAPPTVKAGWHPRPVEFGR
jgi:hypothetical protein